MSHYEYRVSQEIAQHRYPFYALLFDMFREADTDNLERLKQAFPEKFEEFQTRYHAPGGWITGEAVPDENQIDLPVVE